MTQLDLFDHVAGAGRVIAPEPDPARFDGATYEAEHDRDRLGAQLRRTLDLMRDGRWRTLAEISAVTGDPEASASARLRDCRKPRFGGYTVEKRRRGEAARGLFEYRLATP